MTIHQQNPLKQVREHIGQNQPQNVQASARGQGMDGHLISKGAALLGLFESTLDYKFQISKDYLASLGSANYRVSAWGDEWRVNIDNPSIEVVAPSFTQAVIKAATSHVQITLGVSHV
jgi:hypothetical protein